MPKGALGSTAMTSTTSEIIWSRPASAGCVFCTIIRDTRGCALDQAQRFNFFPASPLCCVTFVLTGEFHVIDPPDGMERPWTGAKMPGLAFSGPQLRPLITWNPGETHAIVITFYPDAFSAMTGLDLSPFAGRTVPAAEALPHTILQACRDFFDAVPREGIDQSFAVIQDRIETLWADVRPVEVRSTKWIEDWRKGVVQRAAQTGSGRSTRQIARRVKSWTGVNERDLQGLGHTEQLYAKLHAALEAGDVDWAGLAAAAGFADQAHMIRQMRRHTGFTPEQLRQSAASEEAFWGYRLLGQYFDPPEGRPTAVASGASTGPAK
jgi:AraC-like DNA-binding protein